MRPIKLDPSLDVSVVAQKNLAQKRFDRLYLFLMFAIYYMPLSHEKTYGVKIANAEFGMG